MKLYCHPNRSCTRQREAVKRLGTSRKALQWTRLTPQLNKRHLQVRCSMAPMLPSCGVAKTCNTCDFCQLVHEDDFCVRFQMPKMSEMKVKQKWLPNRESSRGQVTLCLYRWGCFPKAGQVANICQMTLFQLTNVLCISPKTSVSQQNVPKSSPPAPFGFHLSIEKTAGQPTRRAELKSFYGLVAFPHSPNWIWPLCNTSLSCCWFTLESENSLMSPLATSNPKLRWDFFAPPGKLSPSTNIQGFLVVSRGAAVILLLTSCFC